MQAAQRPATMNSDRWRRPARWRVVNEGLAQAFGTGQHAVYGIGMAKPKTMSPPIQFRIPIHLWPVLERNAAKHGRSPAEHCQARIVEALQRQYGDDDVPGGVAFGP